jgi:hypothetical protein
MTCKNFTNVRRRHDNSHIANNYFAQRILHGVERTASRSKRFETAAQSGRIRNDGRRSAHSDGTRPKTLGGRRWDKFQF